MKKISISFFFTLCLTQLFAQNHYARFESIDIKHYDFEIHLNDSTNRIEGITSIDVNFLKPTKMITLDFVGKNNSDGTGMEVSKITYNNAKIGFTHNNNQLEINFEQSFSVNQNISFEIYYAGIPGDGLIISENKFGDRTFFADNWPDRAHNWIPCVDHPSDKATLDFKVYAPEKYQVVSNGYLIEESNVKNGFKLTHWKENVPISTKIMVIGVSRFAVINNGEINGIPISSWVFPQNREQGFSDYSVGTKPLEYFSNLVGDYPYEKLANVQSKTKYGGMENAGCIFYSERSVTGKNQAEGLIAHETAHQWFGNSVTEQNWHHVWLSEGFATYLTQMYFEYYKGEEYFRQQMAQDRERVIRYANRKLAPIIDTTVTNYNQLLSANSYQKASWFLHMLREKTGNERFIKSLQEYYFQYVNSTALTSDFQKVTENISGLDLDSFFHDWLYQPGFPKIHFSWKQKKDNSLVLKLNQAQENYLFHFPLEIELQFEDGTSEIKTIQINEDKVEISFSTRSKIKEIKLDPEVKLLFEEIH